MKPILFNTEMVRAILDGRKTVTRRILKLDLGQADIDKNDKNYFYLPDKDGEYHHVTKFAPYKVGDVLYVRETWRVGAWSDDGYIAVDYFADGHANKEWIEIKNDEAFERYWIQSTNDAIKAGIEHDEDGYYHWERGKAPTRWRPSIHMPKEAARIFLKVTDVRVERLQDITEEDAIKEGLRSGMITGGCTARFKFQELWNSTIKKTDLDQYGWNANPWVWVFEFERCEKPESEDNNEHNNNF